MLIGTVCCLLTSYNLQCTLLHEPCGTKLRCFTNKSFNISIWFKQSDLTSLLVSSEQLLWNRLYCAIVSDNTEVFSSFLGARVKTFEESDSGTSGACLLKETNQSLDDTKTLEISGQENNQFLERVAETNFISDCERHKGNLIGDCSDVSKPDSNISENTEASRININELAPSSEVENGREDIQQSNGETPAKGIVDVINGRFGESGDTLLHVASRSSRTEIVLRLLECGADPAVK